jgi:streptomycin 6-kinase
MAAESGFEDTSGRQKGPRNAAGAVGGPAIELPEAVRAKAALLGEAGERWVRELPDVVASLVRDWGLSEVGPAMAGGSAAFLAPVLSDVHGPSVLKVVIPDGLEGDGTFASHLAALDAGRYLDVHERDVARRALLVERLGRPLGALGLTTEQQLDALARTVAATWRPYEGTERFLTGADKAVYLAGFIEDRWEETGRPCAEATIAEAIACTERRRRAFDAERAVFVHGDAHAGNLLEAVPGDPSRGFKLIDPEGLVSEPAHDLGVSLRGYDPGAGGAARLRTWAERLAAVAGIDAEPVWEWAFIERGSTGLYLTQLGLDDEARDYLRVADLAAAFGEMPAERNR